MPAYWIARAKMTDDSAEARAGMERYVALVAEAMKRHPFETLSRAAGLEILEGTKHFDRYYLHVFPSMAEALAFYHSPEYQQAISARSPYCDTEIVIVDGVDTATLR